MKYIVNILLAVYELCIALPILLAATIFTALFTIVCIPWKNSEFVHKVQQLWSRLFFWLFGSRVVIDGTENLKKGQSYVFVCNHESNFDVWAIYGWLPVVYKWLMKAELRKVPFIGAGCAAAGHIFIERGATKQALQSLQRAKDALVDGVSVVIFPEGTRSKTGEVGRFKRGAFQIAFDMELPVVPLSLSGPRDILPRGEWVVRPFRTVYLHVGKPVDISAYNNPEHRDEAITLLHDMVVAGKRA